MFFLLIVLYSSTVEAKVTNYIGAYVQAGEWSMLPSQSAYKMSYGVGGGAGFLYEMQAGFKYTKTRFLLQLGVGPQGGMTSFMQSSTATEVLENQLDLDKEKFDYVYEVTDRRDRYTNVGVQVPLMVGVQHGKFYMLAGVKVNANLYKRVQAKALINTYGRYEGIPDLRNMPEYQFFTDYKKEGKAPANINNLDINISAEIGGRVGGIFTDATGYDVPKRLIEYRLAGFFEYGLMDLHTPHDGVKSLVLPSGYNDVNTEPVHSTYSMMTNLGINDIMSTANFASKVNNLMVGIKFTILFQIPEEPKCVMCQDNYVGSTPRRSGSRGMKYEE